MGESADLRGGHRPVLLQEVLTALAVREGGLYIDGTVGGGGHAEAILLASAPTGRLLGLDRDPQAVAYAGRRLSRFGERCRLRQASYAEMGRLARAEGFVEVDGILLDLGYSSLQIDDAQRGFAFRLDGPLDMRYDPQGGGTTAADLVNELDAEALARLLWRYGEERRSRAIARAIVAARPLRTTGELAALIERVVPRRGRIHPATRTFQALRIAVNRELEALEAVLPQALELLRPGGRLAVITFHSLEDRIVKRTFRRWAGRKAVPSPLPLAEAASPRVRWVTRKPIVPSAEEREVNRRSRSAKLRVVEKVEGSGR